MNEQSAVNNRGVGIAVAVGIAAALIAIPLVQNVAVERYLATARAYTAGSDYDIAAAQENYENVLAFDADNEDALYSLARIYYITGDYDKSLSAIATYKKQYPDKKRIHYIAGLSNAYAGNLEQAEKEFTAFINSGLSTWPGYLDLAWVHFQQSEFEEAYDLLTQAEGVFGGNAWLNTSLGGVNIALDDLETARRYLLAAREQAETLTEEDWRNNFSFNDPSKFEEEIAQMKDVINFNLALAEDRESEVSAVRILGVPFANMSTRGIGSGLVVSACGDSCTEISCVSSANVCGQVNTGTQNSCTGNVCSVSTPPNPSGTCAIATQCGNASGFVGCNGGCNITSYPVCLSATNPTGFDEVTWINLGDGSTGGAGLGVTDIAAQIVVFPALVTPGGQTVVRWASTETESCAVTGENGDSWVGPVAGEQVSRPISQETTYVLVCEGFDGSTVTDSATVRVVPVWEEF